MKKLLLSVAIASALGLAGCSGDETIAEIKQEVQESGSQSQPFSRVVFDPASGKVSAHNDLAFLGTTDGTLNMPGETVAAGESPDYLDPQTAFGALDGWSTSTPFPLAIDMGTPDATLDAASVAQPGAVHIFEAVLGGPLSPEAACTTAPAISLCQMGAELTFGVDFVTKADGNKIIVVPLKPLKAAHGYVLALTNSILDSNSNPVQGSTTYELMRRDIVEFPLPLPSMLGLQTLVNSYENGVTGAGVAKDALIYTAAFTTQSTQDVLQTVKLLMAGVPGAGPSLSPVFPAGFTAGQALVGKGLLAPGSESAMIADMADVHVATLTAPYYLDKPTAQNCDLTAAPFQATADNCPSLFSRFEAKGDSPVTVLGAMQSGVLSQESFAAQYGAQAPFFGRGAFTESADLVGMTFTIDTPLGPMALDQARHTTKFNPWPAIKNFEDIPVLITKPNIANINLLRQGQVMMAGGTWDEATMGISKPGTGWPVMIYSHGITTSKETLLAFAGAMANAGVVVVAIDHTFHGERIGMANTPFGPAPISATPIDFNADGVDDSNVTSYLNLASLLTARDNLRQSEADLLSLRLAVNSLAGTEYDVTKVSFFGHSLGGIVGTTFVALANSGQPLPGDPYGITAASFLAPAGSVPGVLLNSMSFSPVVKAGLTASDTFQQLLAGAALAQGIDADTLAAMKAAGAPEYQGLVDAVYAPFSAEFNFAAQTVVDSADQINYAQTLGATTDALHVMEVVGDGEANLADAVVPNNALSPDSPLQLPLVGTDPLIALIGLDNITETTGDFTSPVGGVVRFAKGHHGSILTPAVVPGVAEDAAANLAVTKEMQTQLAAFIGSQGTFIPVIAVEDDVHSIIAR